MPMNKKNNDSALCQKTTGYPVKHVYSHFAIVSCGERFANKMAEVASHRAADMEDYAKGYSKNIQSIVEQKK